MFADEAFEERAARERARLGALESYLRAVERTDPALAGRLRPVIEAEVAPCADALDALEALDGNPAQPWADLAVARRTIDDVAARCQRLLAGALARATGADDGACALADRLLDEIAAGPKPVWRAITVPSTTEQFDLKDGCIRVGWGSADVAALALAIHELGHAASYELSRLAVVQGRFTIENPMLERTSQVPQGEDVRVQHLSEHWADAYAVYVAGPAPLAAMVDLVFPPGDAARSTATHPSPNRRVAVMLGVLEALDATGVHARTARRWIAARWAGLVTEAGATVESDPAVPDTVALCLDDLRTCLPGGDYRRLGRAYALAGALTGAGPLDARPGDRLVDVVNGAWLARIDPDRQVKLAEVTARSRAHAEAVAARA